MPLLPASRRHHLAVARTTRVMNVAHRGASAELPENTLAAVRRAIAHDADFVEVDVQRSKDGQLVVMHDTTLARTTNAREVFPARAPWRVSDFTAAELATLHAGNRFDAPFDREPIPTLDDVLGVLSPSRTGLLLELKAPGLYPGIVADVAASLRRFSGHLGPSGPSRVVVQSFDVAAVKEHKARAPEIPVGILGAPPTGHLPALATWADQVNPNHRVLTGAYVDQIHRHGMSCHVWTVNRSSAMNRALRLGVDGIITNHPGGLADLLRARRAADR